MVALFTTSTTGSISSGLPHRHTYRHLHHRDGDDARDHQHDRRAQYDESQVSS